jgi:hypothetical protein
MAISGPHRKPLSGAVKRCQRPVPIALAIDLKPRARAGKHQGPCGLSDRTYPMDGLLLLERTILAITPLLSCRSCPPLLIQDADRRSVRPYGVRVDHFQATRAIVRRAHGTEVCISARLSVCVHRRTIRRSTTAHCDLNANTRPLPATMMRPCTAMGEVNRRTPLITSPAPPPGKRTAPVSASKA